MFTAIPPSPCASTPTGSTSSPVSAGTPTTAAPKHFDPVSAHQRTFILDSVATTADCLLSLALPVCLVAALLCASFLPLLVLPNASCSFAGLAAGGWMLALWTMAGWTLAGWALAKWMLAGWKLEG